MTFECPVRKRAIESPSGTCLMHNNQTWNWEEFDKLIQGTCRRFEQHGLNAGDTVAVLSENSVQFAALFFAAYRSGVVIVPLNLRRPKSEWRAAIEQTECRVVAHSQRFAEYAADLDIDCMDLSQICPDPEASSEPVRIDSDTEHSVFTTSGSEGAPKGVVLTVGNHIYNALGSNDNIELRADDCWLASLPFYHVGGAAILFRTALSGASAYITERFKADVVNRLIDGGTVTHLSVVSTMLKQILDSRGDRPLPESLKSILLGGGPVSSELLSRIRDQKLPVLTTYGFTEAASQVTTLSPDDPVDKLTTAGRPLKYRELQILGEDDQPCSSGGLGRIAVRGEVLFRGYADGTKIRTRSPGEWFITNDIGYLDEDGYLVVKGRSDDMFVSGGENVFPTDIEAEALRFAGVSEAAVISIEDDTWGKRPVLFVCSSGGAGIRMKALRSHLEINLSRILLPDTIIELESIPRQSIDKVDKSRLLEIYRQVSGE